MDSTSRRLPLWSGLPAHQLDQARKDLLRLRADVLEGIQRQIEILAEVDAQLRRIGIEAPEPRRRGIGACEYIGLSIPSGE